ncbi:hypothetical protein K1T71_002787 [Dendrolimus kikuchii]|uniref:Uncharacterized protein n=1 Tax=Dendrolimus kikuchii TaxID=765133 RepID=A0ACC1DE38_9NEOP|nr:hypothetical protein K1T71_002787 [Dendrolimus kikuchii]
MVTSAHQGRRRGKTGPAPVSRAPPARSHAAYRAFTADSLQTPRSNAATTSPLGCLRCRLHDDPTQWSEDTKE